MVHLPISECIHCLREIKWEFITTYLIFLTSSPLEYMFFNQMFIYQYQLSSLEQHDRFSANPCSVAMGSFGSGSI